MARIADACVLLYWVCSLVCFFSCYLFTITATETATVQVAGMKYREILRAGFCYQHRRVTQLDLIDYQQGLRIEPIADGLLSKVARVECLVLKAHGKVNGLDILG